MVDLTMELAEFVSSVPSFSSLSHVDKLKHLGWYLHVHREMERFTTADMKDCYERLHLDKPQNIGSLLNSLSDKKPKELLKDRSGSFRMEHCLREAFDKKYGKRPASMAVDKMLAELPDKLSDPDKSKYLSEAISCYRHFDYRAAIVMTWQLAYDHFLHWIMADANRLSDFNSRIAARLPRKAGFTVVAFDDFEDFREKEVLEISRSAGITSVSVNKILEEKLIKRNTSAHPTNVIITLYQVEDVISDLVNNVILKLV